MNTADLTVSVTPGPGCAPAVASVFAHHCVDPDLLLRTVEGALHLTGRRVAEVRAFGEAARACVHEYQGTPIYLDADDVARVAAEHGVGVAFYR